MPKQLARVLCVLTATAGLALAGCDDDTGTARDGGGRSDASADQATLPDASPDGKTDTSGGTDQAPDTGGMDQGPDTTGDTDVGPPPAAASYEVTAALRPDPAAPMPVPFPGATLPASDTFTMFVNTQGQARLVASRGGLVSVAVLARQGAGWVTSEPFRVGPTAGYNGVCLGFGSFSYDRAEISLTGGGLTGTVTGHASYISGDVVQALPFVGTLAGTLDCNPPVASFGAATPHPMDQLRVAFSETLPAGTSAALLADGGLRVALEGDTTPDSYKPAFWSKIALQPATSYRLAVEPALVDLAGNTSSAPALTVTTAAVPLIPEDGFEGTTRPFLQEAAEIVDASVAPPLAGTKSLLFRPLQTSRTARFSARLAVAAGDRFVRATLRPVLAERTWRHFFTTIRIAGRDGAPVSRMIADAADPLTCAGTGGAGPCYAAPVQLEIPLPAGTTGEVMIDVNRDFGCGLVPPEPGFLLDDLRVE